MSDRSNVADGDTAAPSNNPVGGPSSGSAGQTPARNPVNAAPKSHNLVWVNSDYCPVPKTKDSVLSDAQVREKMGLTMTPAGAPVTASSPSPNQFGKRPKGQGPTPTSKPAEKKRKKGDKRRSVNFV